MLSYVIKFAARPFFSSFLVPLAFANAGDFDLFAARSQTSYGMNLVDRGAERDGIVPESWLYILTESTRH